jgi:hypothetical protein
MAISGSMLRSLAIRTIGPREVMAKIKRTGPLMGFHMRLRARYETVSTRP